MKTRKKRLIWKLLPMLIALLLLGAFFIYTGIYYSADDSASKALVSDDKVSISRISQGLFFDGPGTADALVFYPGGKVEETAYAPLLRQLAEHGVDTFLISMPFRLAVFGKNRADGIISAYQYDRWFIGGHSLGGAMAALYAADHQKLNGLILLAAYPTKPLDKEDLEIVIYGSLDGVLNTDKVIDGRQYASDHLFEYVIPGGNHAQFGNYGAQSGDREAVISPQQQQQLTVEYIIQCLSGN
ncbi:MAG: hypothetical protein J5887_03835 [Erysipelotrichaceae bacterium]|nr:hypothetical protein [Erysipelotrichaceae bacterium]